MKPITNSLFDTRKRAACAVTGTLLPKNGLRAAFLFCFLLAILAAGNNRAHAATVTEKTVTLRLPSGTERICTLVVPDECSSALVMVEGRQGVVPDEAKKTDTSPAECLAEGFMMRNRSALAQQGFAVIVPHIPPIETKEGSPTPAFREEEAEIETALSYLRASFPVPCWIVAIDTGTLAAAEYAAKKPDAVNGIVLLSSPIRFSDGKRGGPPSRGNKGILALPLDRITAPTLLVSHRKDRCYSSPASAPLMIQLHLRHARVFKAVYLSGKPASRCYSCGTASEHSFSGIDSQAVAAISQFITQQTEHP